jgi:formylglycine-generating enzyme required for sulfatase activity
MKTKNFLFSLLLVGTAGVMSAQAQKPKPKLAVLVVGMGSAAKSDDFAARLGSDLNRDGEYTLVTKNNAAVADMLNTLRTQTTPVDTTGLAAWGKSNGIDFVQLVVQDTIAGTTVITEHVERVGRVVDCNSGKLSERGTYRMSFATREMMEASPGLQMVQVPGGVFTMGCRSERDGSCNTDETPFHTVRVNSFSIGKYEITQAQWREVMGSLTSKFTNDFSSHMGDNKPMLFVSHDDIVQPDTGFLVRLNALTGRSYRLPTEAEWEYAARGCSAGVCDSFQYSGSNTMGDVAYSGKISGGPATVGTRKPNGLGIYDMSGNASEWCSDWYSSTYYTTDNNPLDNPENTTRSSTRTLRGGDWYYFLRPCRVAQRGNTPPSERYYTFGVRVVLD